MRNRQALHEAVGHALVVDQEFQGLAHLDLLQRLGLGVHRQVPEGAARHLLHRHVRVRLQRFQLLAGQAAGDVDIALLQQQHLRGRVEHMAEEDPLEARLAPPVVVEPVHHQALIRLPAAELVGAGAGGVGVQPLMAEIAVLGVRLHHLGIDHRGDRGAEAVQHEAGRVGLVGLEHQRPRIRRRDHAVDILRGQAELADDEGRRQVQLDGAADRIGRVLGRQRVAGVELDPVADLEAVAGAVIGDGPALGDAGQEVRRILGVVVDQPVIDLVDVFGGRELEHLGRVERDDVVDAVGLDQRVLRRLGPGRQSRAAEQDRGDGAAKDCSHLDAPPVCWAGRW